MVPGVAVAITGRPAARAIEMTEMPAGLRWSPSIGRHIPAVGEVLIEGCEPPSPRSWSGAGAGVALYTSTCGASGPKR